MLHITTASHLKYCCGKKNLQEQSNKKRLMGGMYFTMHVKSMYENFPTLKFSFDFPLYSTCIIQRWVKLQIWICRHIQNRIRKHFTIWIRGPGGFNWWKNRRRKSCATVPLFLKADRLVASCHDSSLGSILAMSVIFNVKNFTSKYLTYYKTKWPKKYKCCASVLCLGEAKN